MRLVDDVELGRKARLLERQLDGIDGFAEITREQTAWRSLPMHRSWAARCVARGESDPETPFTSVRVYIAGCSATTDAV